jgi:hypothetical protein
METARDTGRFRQKFVVRVVSWLAANADCCAPRLDVFNSVHMSYHIFISYPRIADEKRHVSDIRAHLEHELQIKTGDKDLVVFQDSSKLEGVTAGARNWRTNSRSQMRSCCCFRLSGLRAAGAARNCKSISAMAAPRR